MEATNKVLPPAARRDVELSQLFTFSSYGTPLCSDGSQTAASLVSVKGGKARWQTWCSAPAEATKSGALLRRATAVLSRDDVTSAQYVARDGAALRDALAAELRSRAGVAATAAAAAASPGCRASSRPGSAPVWTRADRVARIEVVALTPATTELGSLQPQPEQLLDSALLLVQHVAPGSSRRGDREASAALSALLRSRAEAQLRRFTPTTQATSFVGRLNLEFNAVGVMLWADNAAMRIGVAMACVRGATPQPATLLWSRELPLGGPAEEGVCVLMNLLMSMPHQLGHRWRVPLLLARLAAWESYTRPDTSALSAAVAAAKAARLVTQTAIEAARRATACFTAAEQLSEECKAAHRALTAAYKTNDASWDALFKSVDADNDALVATSAVLNEFQYNVAELRFATTFSADAPLGAGNHSVVYAVRWAVDNEEQKAAAEAAFAKVAIRDDARLAEGAMVLRALPKCASLPRLLHSSRLGFMQFNLPAEASDEPQKQPAFLVLSPAGASLCAVLGRLPPHAGDAATAARRIIADVVSQGLLDALQAAHSHGIAHGNMKMENVALTPAPPARVDADAENADDADAAALLLALRRGAWQPRALLIDWGTALPIGKASYIRSQRGVGPEVTAALRSDEDYWVLGEQHWRVTPQLDLEPVAYIAAATAAGCPTDKANFMRVPWLLPPWLESMQPKPGCTRCAAVTAARALWLKEHPEALGDSGRRFLEHVRAGRAVYTWRIEDAAHAALLADEDSAAPLRRVAESDGRSPLRRESNVTRVAAERAARLGVCWNAATESAADGTL